MTSLTLLLWIAGGVLLQIAVFLAIGFSHHWQQYLTLRSRVAGSDPEGALQSAASPQELMPSAWAGFRTFRVASKVLEDANGQICSFYLVPEDAMPLAPFLPGQFLTFKLELPAANGGVDTVVRCYSLSDAPQKDHYRVSIKRVTSPMGSQAPPGVSSNYFHDHVQMGSLLQVRSPAGHFCIDRSDSPSVLIGGGIGITPLLSMLNWCLKEQPGREVWLFYGVRNYAELAMPEHLISLAKEHAEFHLHLCFSEPSEPEVTQTTSETAHHHQTRVTVSLLRRLLPLKPYHFYICGPAPMLQSLVPALEDWGVPDGHIHFEAFGPASIKRKRSAQALPPETSFPGASGDLVVTFEKSGKQLPWRPVLGSLLELAEANGIAVNSGCRAGGCGTCQTIIRSGEVAYSQAPDFDPEPGTCLLCVCTPKTAVVLEL